MAKISTYVIDGTIVDGDKVIGSDANNDMVTKNYTVGDLVAYFAASIGGNYLVPYVGANDDVDLGSFDITANDLITTNSIFAGGTEGLANQVLTSQGPGLPTIWSYNSGNQTLQSVLSYGNTANNSITLANASYSINLNQTTGTISLSDIANSRVGYINTGVVHLVGATSVADYYHNGVVYTSGANTISVLTNVFNNQTIRYPSAGGVLALSVNGVSADITGAITIPVGSSQNLQQVTDVGNSTTNPILITDYLSIEDPVSSNTGVINSAGLLSANRDYNLPDENGTFVLSVNGAFADAQGNINITSGSVSGSGTTNYIPKWSGTTSLSNSQIFDNGTAVGIGTATPSGGILDVVGISKFSSNTNGAFDNVISIENSGTGTYRYAVLGIGTLYSHPSGTNLADIRLSNSNTTGIRIYASNSELTNIPSGAGFQFFNNADPNYTGKVFFDSGADNNAAIIWRTAQTANPITERMRLDSVGDLTISNLATGGADEMVTVDSSGKLNKQAIPTGGSIPHGTASGTDTYTVTISGVASYVDGDSYLVRFTNGNTTGCTLNINGLGARTLYRNNDGPLIGGDIIDGAEMLCVFNSTLNGFQTIGAAPNTLIAYVTNDDSVTITKGQPVYAFSGTGDRMTVKLAYNTTDATSAQTVGLVASTSIAPNQKGIIMMQGLLDGLSILPTATWSDGDAVYLGATAGSITNIKPSAPNHLVYLGVVTTASNGAAGRLYVRVQNGYELQELHNVSLTNPPNNNDGLFYETATSLWKNKSIDTVLGYTPVGGTGTTNELAYFTAASTIGSLTTATYPSLTELSYVKGVTSAIQTQIDGKQADSAWVPANSQSISGWSATTTKLIQYKLLGNKTAILQWEIVGTGTGGSASLTLPFTSSAWGNQYGTYHVQQSTQTIGICVVAASSTTLTFYAGATVPTNFTNGQARNLRGQMIINLT